MLRDKEAVELSLSDAEQMIGPAPNGQAAGTRPFLVRNVVPSLLAWLKAGLGSVNRVGSGLWIRFAVIGCGGFRKTPVIMFLSDAPERVDVDVIAAL